MYIIEVQEYFSCVVAARPICFVSKHVNKSTFYKNFTLVACVHNMN